MGADLGQPGSEAVDELERRLLYVDLIVLPDRVVRTHTGLTRPTEVLDDHPDDAKRASIPVLVERGSSSLPE